MPFNSNGSGDFPDPPSKAKRVGRFVGGVAGGFAVAGTTIVGGLAAIAIAGALTGVVADVFSEGYELGSRLIGG